MGIITKSQAVIRIHEKNKGIADHALVLFFLVDDALNNEQQQLLKRFGLFFNTLIHHRNMEQGYYIQAVTQEDNSAANLQRHALTNSIGDLDNIVDAFRDNLIDREQFFSEFDEAIYKTSSIFASYRYFFKEQLDYKEVNLSSLWGKVFKQFESSSKRIQLTTRTLDILKYRIDPDLLGAVFFNLIQNAEEAGASSVWLEFEKPKDELVLRFFDNGEGVKGENIPKLFSLGHTTKSSGTGFGLHYCRNTVQKLGGGNIFRTQ